ALRYQERVQKCHRPLVPSISGPISEERRAALILGTCSSFPRRHRSSLALLSVETICPQNPGKSITPAPPSECTHALASRKSNHCHQSLHSGPRLLHMSNTREYCVPSSNSSSTPTSSRQPHPV